LQAPQGRGFTGFPAAPEASAEHVFSGSDCTLPQRRRARLCPPRSSPPARQPSDRTVSPLATTSSFRARRVRHVYPPRCLRQLAAGSRSVHRHDTMKIPASQRCLPRFALTRGRAGASARNGVDYVRSPPPPPRACCYRRLAPAASSLTSTNAEDRNVSGNARSFPTPARSSSPWPPVRSECIICHA